MPHTESPAFLRQTLKEGGTSASSYKITFAGKLIDDALEAVEKDNVNGARRHTLPARGARRVHAGARIKLKNVLNKNYTQLQTGPDTCWFQQLLPSFSFL